MKKSIEITFRSLDDFRRRIARLWQEQNEDEVYEFIFLCPEAKKEFEKLIQSFKDMVDDPRS